MKKIITIVFLVLALAALVVLFPQLASAALFPAVLPSTTLTYSASLSRIADGSTGHCVAPCYIEANATATTSTVTAVNGPFFDVEYRWNFGDTAGGATWATTNNSKNTARGPIGAHVYETAGTYFLCGYATDGTSTTPTGVGCPTGYQLIALITVDDPNVTFVGSATWCIAATVTPTAGSGNCPASASVLKQSNFTSAILTALGSSGNVRILFNRGDTFTVPTTPALLNKAGPGIIGAYGTGALPFISDTSGGSNTNGPLRLGNGNTTISDWRIQDLQFDGASNTGSNGVQAVGNISQFTFDRITVSNTHGGISLDAGGIAAFGGTLIPDQVGIVDYTNTSVVGGSGAGPIFVFSTNYAMMGASINSQGNGEQADRYPYLNGATINNNSIQHAANGKELIKLHGPCQNGVNCTLVSIVPNVATQKVVISDNIFNDSTNTVGQMVVAGPEAPGAYELVNTLLVEGNQFTAGAGTNQAMIWYGVTNGVGRNNLINFTSANCCGGTNGNGIWMIATRGAEAIAPFNLGLYNNSHFSSSSGSLLEVTRTDTTASNITITNNVIYAPNVTTTTVISGTGSNIPVPNNNSVAGSGTTGVKTSPKYTSATPQTCADFKPTSGSYALGAGAVNAAKVPVWSDCAWVATASPPDMGAAHGP